MSLIFLKLYHLKLYHETKEYKKIWSKCTLTPCINKIERSGSIFKKKKGYTKLIVLELFVVFKKGDKFFLKGGMFTKVNEQV